MVSLLYYRANLEKKKNGTLYNLLLYGDAVEKMMRLGKYGKFLQPQILDPHPISCTFRALHRVAITPCRVGYRFGTRCRVGYHHLYETLSLYHFGKCYVTLCYRIVYVS